MSLALCLQVWSQASQKSKPLKQVFGDKTDQHDQALLQEDLDSPSAVASPGPPILMTSSKRRGNRTAGFLRRNFRECTPKVKSATYRALQWYAPHWSMPRLSGEAHKHKDIHLLDLNSTTASSQVLDQQLHGLTGHRAVSSYIHGGKSSLEQRETTDLPGDALDKINNGGLVDINPANFFRHSDPRRTRGALQKTAPGTDPTACLGLCSLFPCIDSDWNLSRVLPTAVSLVPSFESFHSRLGRSLHNLKPVPTSP